MKSNLFLALLFSQLIIAQNNSQNFKLAKVPQKVDVSMPYQKTLKTGFEPIEFVNKPGHQLPEQKTSTLVKIGETSYDLQTNGSVRRQIFNPGDGTISAVWTYSSSLDLSATDRGSGYNYFNSTWGNIPTARIEPFRTGWGNIVVTGKNEEIIIAHPGSGTLALSRRTKGTGVWSTNLMPGNYQYIWPRVAVGGPGDSSIHVIAVTSPSAFGGSLVNGLDGALVYFRSLDGGYTWDIIDSILPGLDTGNFAFCPQVKGFGGDEYAIAARGNTIAIAVFDDWNDIVLLKSTDNGNSWNKTIVFDVLNNPQVNTDTIESSDNSGALIIDNNGMVHMFFGRMRYLDDNFSDNQYSYFPATNGLFYWNENMGAASGSGLTNAQIITGALDLNNNGTLDISSNSEIALYYASLSSFPSAGVDANNNIYLTYSALAENLSNGSQFYRHIYVMKSTDGGSSWSQPVDILNNGGGSGLYDFSEAVFADLADLVDNHLHIIFQEDSEPGLAVRGDNDGFTMNNIYYYKLTTDLNVTVGMEEKPSNDNFKIYPNPAKDAFNISYLSKENNTISIEIYNNLGQLIYRKPYNLIKGKNVLSMNLENLTSGIYTILINDQENIKTSKLIIE
ncbi:MAG: hypothetical protein KatS3mg034_0518 [Vicingaceae bacterium]|nr:MAG: hypothetical protein KatS3mg034_0518 [Vicingaceae bacterium]